MISIKNENIWKALKQLLTAAGEEREKESETEKTGASGTQTC